MMNDIDKDFPCEHCGCEAMAHYVSIIQPNGCSDLCSFCMAKTYSHEAGSERDNAIKFAVHSFKPDNLKYLAQIHQTHLAENPSGTK